ncbi:succinate dehydrogenase assembly factor 2 [Mesorhizobium sp. AR10]|uniref:succinate dehydrogenase assembly factor 2 n=1 Tax=Mesorhizobium sp. AR10 TaxID=2865839 RepID=UPI0021602914|nr:succinate dehydrogenase assembly factor 2 [Mesorhizobium sp. AR10]UVK38817.1 succinate dehydrogenase assembly factor 2 [Mesorhizobium sp. AR10]
MNRRLSYASQREDLNVRNRRVLLRCWHRGTQESGLILGSFAEQSIDKLNDAQLDRLEALLDCPDADLFGWIIGNRPAPAEHNHDVMRLLRGFCGVRHQRPLQNRQRQN